MRTTSLTIAVLGLFAAAACADGGGGGADRVHDDSVTASAGADDRAPSTGLSETSTPKPDRPPVLGYEVVARYPHDKRAYTQGLVIVDGQLYESTGRHGESSVRLVELETGKVLKRRDVDIEYFGEGLASVGGLLYQITWKEQKVLLYDRATLRPLSYTYSYKGQGWGLTTSPDGQLVMSDGTDELRFIEPKGFKETRRLKVTNAGRPLREINELEWSGSPNASRGSTPRPARSRPGWTCRRSSGATASSRRSRTF